MPATQGIHASPSWYVLMILDGASPFVEIVIALQFYSTLFAGLMEFVLFGSPITLTVVSSDGTEPPKVYVTGNPSSLHAAVSLSESV